MYAVHFFTLADRYLDLTNSFTPTCLPGEISEQLLQSYTREFVMRTVVLEDLAHASTRDGQVVYLSALADQPLLTHHTRALFHVLRQAYETALRDMC